MEALYKYLTGERLTDLLEHARIRIGTLYEYRDTSEHPREVADRAEGRRQIVVNVSPTSGAARTRAGGASGDQREATAEAVAETVERTIEDHQLDRNGAAEVSVVARSADNVVVEACSPNLYLFSASTRCDQELLQAMPYDACVRIVDPQRFFTALTRALPTARAFLGYRSVIYEDPRRPRVRDAGVHPAFFKRADYAHQAEVRALWEPRADHIEPVVVVCEEAARLCTLSLSRRW